MAERFSDPLFEKVGEMSIAGYCMWMEFFEMEYKQLPEQEPNTNKLVEYFEAKGGHML